MRDCLDIEKKLDIFTNVRQDEIKDNFNQKVNEMGENMKVKDDGKRSGFEDLSCWRKANL